MSTRVAMSMARLQDADSMAAFLQPIPNADGLSALLGGGKPVASRAYDDDSETARFVVSDGHTVKCFSVNGVTIDQAEMIAFVGVDLAPLDVEGFRDLVLQALGPTFEPATDAL